MAGKPEERSIENPESHSKKAGRERSRKKARHPLIEKHPVLGRIGTGLAAASLAAGLACAPASRAQETTPSARTTQVAQTPDARVAPATTGTAPPRPATVVAQVERPNVATYDQASVGAPPPQFTEVSEQDVMDVMGPAFPNSSQYERGLESNKPANWELFALMPGAPIFEVYARTSSGELQRVGGPLGPTQISVILELPTAESDLAGAGMLAVVDPAGVSFHFYNKTTGSYDFMIASIAEANLPADPARKLKVVVEMINGEPVLYIFSPNSVRTNSQGNLSGVSPGAVIAKVSVALGERSYLENIAHPTMYSDVFVVSGK